MGVLCAMCGRCFVVRVVCVSCEVLVQRGLTVDNASVLLQASDERHATRLRELCVRFVVRHFDAVTKSTGFQLLSRELILDVLQSR